MYTYDLNETQIIALGPGAFRVGYTAVRSWMVQNPKHLLMLLCSEPAMV